MMTYRPAPATQAEIKRAVAAVMAAGLSVDKVETDRTGKVTVYTQSAESRDTDKTGWEDLE